MWYLGASALRTHQLLRRCWARHITATHTSLFVIFLDAYTIIICLFVNQQRASQNIQPCANYLPEQTATAMRMQYVQNGWLRRAFFTASACWVTSVDGVSPTAASVDCHHHQCYDCNEDTRLFDTSQLGVDSSSRPYHHSGQWGIFCLAHNKTAILVGTGHWRNGLTNLIRRSSSFRPSPNAPLAWWMRR